jgi:hypothetical protein
MRYPLCLLMAMAVATAIGLHGAPRDERVRVDVVDPGPLFPDAVEAGALQRRCAPTADVLRQAFAERDEPFVPELVRRGEREVCHVAYTPTLPGFRADPDDLPIEELFVNVDSLSLISRRREPLGDSLDISVQVTRALTRPIPITLGMERPVGPHWYAAGAIFHYGPYAPHVVWRQARVTTVSNPWTQDFLKSGRTPEAKRLLVPRFLFEGRASDGETFAPLLASLEEERFVRSRLSWEGGDLQFVRHPLEPDRLILVYGDAAKTYWGANLTEAEYAYVLQREFGADLTIDVSGTVPHADYLVSFLPDDRIAMVAEVVVGRQDIAHAAAALLVSEFDAVPPVALADLVRALEPADALRSHRRRIERLVTEARKAMPRGWAHRPVPGLEQRVDRHAEAFCGGEHAACFQPDGLHRLLRYDPGLFRDWVTQARRTSARQLLGERLLDIVESQLAHVDPRQQARIDRVVRQLEQVGFDVVRVPRFGSDHDLNTTWTGVGYVNSLVVDEDVFVPTLGLGNVEARMIADIQQRLPDRYRVVPVYARYMLLQSGGVHCTVAIVRR